MYKSILLMAFFVTWSIGYQIEDKQEFKGVKCIIKVRLEKEYSLSALKSLGKVVRQECKDEPKVFIFYFLPKQSINSNAWGYTHFTPDLVAIILGTTQSQQTKMKAPSGPILGQWIDHGPNGAKYVLQMKGNQLTMTAIYPDGSTSADLLKEKEENGIKKLMIKGSRYGEYYVIHDSSLGIFDESGVEAITAEKIK